MDSPGLQRTFENKALEWKQLVLQAAKAKDYTAALQHARKAALLLPDDFNLAELVAALQSITDATRANGIEGSSESESSHSSANEADSDSSSSSTSRGGHINDSSSEAEVDGDCMPHEEAPMFQQQRESVLQPGNCSKVSQRTDTDSIAAGQTSMLQAPSPEQHAQLLACAMAQLSTQNDAPSAQTTVAGMRMQAISAGQRQAVRSLRSQISAGLDKLRQQAATHAFSTTADVGQK